MTTAYTDAQPMTLEKALRNARNLTIGPDSLLAQCLDVIEANLTERQAGSLGDVFDMVAHLHRQREWSSNTFGPGRRSAGVVDHIRKELCEIEADPNDLKEWVDVVILALDGAWRSGAKPQEIIDAIVAKQTKNEGRVWPDWRAADPNKAIEHDRSTDDQPPQPPTKESVRGVSDTDVERAKHAAKEKIDELHSQYEWKDYFDSSDASMRAALESFANRGDGDE